MNDNTMSINLSLEVNDIAIKNSCLRIKLYVSIVSFCIKRINKISEKLFKRKDLAKVKVAK